MSGSTTFIDTDGVADASVTNAWFPDIPYDGLVGLYELGGTPGAGETAADVIARSCINLINPAQRCTVVGTPEVAADGLTFTGGSAYLVTPHMETVNVGLLALAKWGGTGTVQHIIGNLGSPTGNHGACLFNGSYTAPNGNIRTSYGVIGSGTGVQALAQTGNMTTQWQDWAMPYVGIRAGIDANARNLLPGTTTTTANTQVRTATELGDKPFLLGSAYNASGSGGKVKMRYALIYSRALTLTAEQVQVRDVLKAQAIADGISLPA
jgi:hypothetical protein